MKQNPSPSFKTKTGRLTPYALACGYVELYETKPRETRGESLTLWHEGGPLYHVRQHNHDNGKRIFWDSFEKLSEARKRFDKAKRDLRLTLATLKP